jgi:hypothetical protein
MLGPGYFCRSYWRERLVLFFGVRHNVRPLRPLLRIVHASVYLFIGVAMTAIAFRSFARFGFAGAEAWFYRNPGMVLVGCLLAFSGAFPLLKPAAAVRRSLPTHPELAEDARILLWVRLIGFGIVSIALVMLAKI